MNLNPKLIDIDETIRLFIKIFRAFYISTEFPRRRWPDKNFRKSGRSRSTRGREKPRRSDPEAAVKDSYRATLGKGWKDTNLTNMPLR